MPARFTDRLRRLADSVWEAQHQHPFVLGIGLGDLAPSRFRHWVRQDYLFLIDYARLLSIASVRAPDVDTAARMAELAHATLHTEMSLHRAYAKTIGVSEAALEREVKAPTCQAYTDFLLRTASLGTYGELVAALLPCMWGFSEAGQRLKARGLPPPGPHREWVEQYASEEFALQDAWCRDVVDAAAKGAPPHRAAPHGAGLPHQQPLRARLLGHGVETGAVDGVGCVACAPAHDSLY